MPWDGCENKCEGRGERTAPPLSEAAFQRAAECLLKVLIQKGDVIDYYHRPDRGAGHNERPGFPDLCLALHSGPAAIELKKNVKTAKTTAAQGRWLACWGDRGALCRTLDDLRAALRRWGVKL